MRGNLSSMSGWRLCVFVWLFAGTLSWANTSSTVASSTSTAPVILVVGDSLSAGYGIDIKDGWVNLLDQRLLAQGYRYRIVNASVSGETSSGARTRFNKLLQLHKPSIVLIEIGANDGLRGLPIQQTKDNLTTLVRSAKSAHAQVVLAGMQMPPNYGARYTQEFAGVFKEIATAEKIPLIPFFLEGVALDPNLVQADGLHPTAAAQPKLLDNVWSALKPLLRKRK